MYYFTEPVNYQLMDPDTFDQPNECSATLQLLNAFIVDRYGGQNLGCYGRRPVRGGNAPSTHAFGAAYDWRYENVTVGRNCPRNTAVALVDWIIEHHFAIGIQQIHDYVGSRIWKAGRGWKDQRPSTTGMGQRWAQWFHFEVHPTAWADPTPIVTRVGQQALATLPPINTTGVTPFPVTPPPTPTSTVSVTVSSLQVLRKGAKGPEVVKLQCLLRWVAGQNEIVPDGIFGSVTEKAVKNVQQWYKLTVDGVVGRQTWTALLDA